MPATKRKPVIGRIQNRRKEIYSTLPRPVRVQPELGELDEEVVLGNSPRISQDPNRAALAQWQADEENAEAAGRIEDALIGFIEAHGEDDEDVERIIAQLDPASSYESVQRLMDTIAEYEDEERLSIIRENEEEEMIKRELARAHKSEMQKRHSFPLTDRQLAARSRIARNRYNNELVTHLREAARVLHRPKESCIDALFLHDCLMLRANRRVKESRGEMRHKWLMVRGLIEKRTEEILWYIESTDYVETTLETECEPAPLPPSDG